MRHHGGMGVGKHQRKKCHTQNVPQRRPHLFYRNKRQGRRCKTYLQYFDWKEPVDKAPSHRILALFRAEEEGFLKVKLNVNKDDVLQALDNIFVKADNASTDLVQDAIDDAWARLLEPSLETEMRAYYKEKADETAVKVFAENLRQLLLAAPLGQKEYLPWTPDSGPDVKS